MMLCFFWIPLLELLYCAGFMLELVLDFVLDVFLLVLLAVIVGYALVRMDVISDYFKLYWKKICVGLGVIFLVCCSVYILTKSSASDKSENDLNDSMVDKDVVDTLQTIMDCRRASMFDGDIFAGVQFGVSKSAYNRIINNYNNKFNSQWRLPKDSGNFI